MTDLVAGSSNISPFLAVLWVLYPMTALVLIELILRAVRNDDDDDDRDGGIMTVSYTHLTLPTTPYV